MKDILMVVVLLGLTGVFSEEVDREVCGTESCEEAATRILKNMDASQDPCNNFYKYACGNFMKTATIREDQPTNNTFRHMQIEVDEQLRSIFDDDPGDSEDNHFRTMRKFYSLCMDVGHRNGCLDSIEERGVEPAVEVLRQAGGWPVLEPAWNGTNFNFLDTEVKLDQLCSFEDGNVFFKIGPMEDIEENTRFLNTIDMPGLGLPGQYLLWGRVNETVKEYFRYMVDVATMYGADQKTATEDMDKVLNFTVALVRTMLRGGDNNPTRFTVPRLQERFETVDWNRLLKGLLPQGVTLKDDEEILIGNPQFIANLIALLNRTPNRTIANYMMWRTVERLTPYLTSQLIGRRRDLVKIQPGFTAEKPRWKKCLDDTNGKFYAALSSLYVNKFFDEVSRQRVNEMVEEIRTEMIKYIKERPWMDKETMALATKKAEKIINIFGYPEEIKDDHKLSYFYNDGTAGFHGKAQKDMSDTNFFEASMTMNRWHKTLQWYRLREPKVRGDWRDHSRVTVVNAFYSPLENAMEFPAAILQKPIFYGEGPSYLNYGAVGTVIGHEITHAFDHVGRQFDSQGRMKDWWTQYSTEQYNYVKQCVIDQYSSFTTRDTGLKVDGVMTQGENMADNGGFKIAYRSYKRKFGSMEPGLPGLEDYSPDQLFVLSFANLWCSKPRPEALENQVKKDVHSPEDIRTNVVLMNFVDFGDIFQCPVGTPMNPEQKCKNLGKPIK